MRKKWRFGDYFVLSLEILLPVISILFTCVLPMSQSLDADQRLAIISEGLSIPLILLQYSVTSSNKSIENSVSTVGEKVDKVSEKINHISPALEKAFLTDNERLQRFAYRRLHEAYDSIQYAINNNNSGDLKPNEYYEELLYLSKLILSDKNEYKDKFTGEIWAMTGFAENEWIADEGYERLWADRLKEMVDAGIRTRRLCLIPDSLYNVLTKQPFEIPASSIQPFWGFIKLLETYYRDEETKKVVEHYFIREGDNSKLSAIKGFFAIRLTNGDLYILHGETVDHNGALTAKVLFDEREIEELRRTFELFTRPIYKIETKLKAIVKSVDFFDFLKQRGILIDLRSS